MARSTAESDDRIYVGVVRLVIQVPGARTRKDRRQVISSVRDRLRHRFEVAVHEIGTSGDPTHQVMVLTTAGNDARVVRSVLDRCVGTVHDHPVAIAIQVDVDVSRWQSSADDWAARMMDELSEDDDG
ncbi:MAG: DUF503 domain-containing protein [Myxococcales bacterium]|nr:DUF503 domain-containing protein [Myxococcales bacterium]